MKRIGQAAMVLGLLASGCNEPPPRTGPARTVASVRRGGGNRRGRRAEGPTPPVVDSVERCPEATFRTLAQLRTGHTVHGPTLCTEVFNGRFAAVLATGSEREASDVWAVFRNGSRNEIHRVGNFPVGARIQFGKISSGWVYLVGTSVARDDQPAGAKVLAIFPLPRPNGDATSVGALAPLEAGLLRASDQADLERRLGFEVPTTQPTEAQARATVQSISEGGPNAFFEHLTPEGAPTLRVWQDGVYQEIDYASPQGDPTSPHVAHAVGHLREVARDMDCSSGERCVARPGPDAPEGATPTEVLLRMDGRRVVVAAILAPGNRALGNDATRPAMSGRERVDNDEDQALARTLVLDGEVNAGVVSLEQGGTRALAFSVTRANGVVDTRAYLIGPGAAPRAFGDDSIGRVDSREFHLRDYDGDGGFELVTIGRRGTEGVVSVASAMSPARASQRMLVHRLDMLRAGFGEPSLATLDGRLRGFAPSPSVQATACGALDRLAGGDERTLRSVTGGALLVIDYGERGQPLRGAPRRLGGRDLRDAGAVLGPFAGKRCGDLQCNFAQSWCRPATAESEGYLWFADGGRRIAAISRFGR